MDLSTHHHRLNYSMMRRLLRRSSENFASYRSVRSEPMSNACDLFFFNQQQLYTDVQQVLYVRDEYIRIPGNSSQ